MLNIVILELRVLVKGTQSERIVEIRYNHISTGMCFCEIKKGTELGKTAKGYIDQASCCLMN